MVSLTVCVVFLSCFCFVFASCLLCLLVVSCVIVALLFLGMCCCCCARRCCMLLCVSCCFPLRDLFYVCFFLFEGGRVSLLCLFVCLRLCL